MKGWKLVGKILLTIVGITITVLFANIAIGIAIDPRDQFKFGVFATISVLCFGYYVFQGIRSFPQAMEGGTKIHLEQHCSEKGKR